MDKRVSVIIPCYNVEKYIDRCLNSITHQTIGMDGIEIICVDDCSTDNTVLRLKEWEKLYPDNLIVVLSEQNGRQGRARNIGLEYASAEWISYIDSDDWVDDNYFEMLFEAVTDDDYEIVGCGHIRDDGTGCKNIYEKETERESEEICENLKGKNIICIDSEEKRRRAIMLAPIKYNAWAKIISKDFILKYNLFFPENLTYEDAFWGSILHFYIKKACILNVNMYHYYVNDSSTVLTKNSNHHLDCITCQSMLWDEYFKRNLYEKYKYEIEIEHLYSCFLAGLKAAIYRYEKPDYNYYLLLRQLVKQRIPCYCDNPYVFSGAFKEIHLLMLKSLDNVLSRDEFNSFVQNIKTIGI